jgi:hypothetical protein
MAEPSPVLFWLAVGANVLTIISAIGANLARAKADVVVFMSVPIVLAPIIFVTTIIFIAARNRTRPFPLAITLLGVAPCPLWGFIGQVFGVIRLSARLLLSGVH